MDDHRRFQDMLGPYVLGELNGDEELELELHLERCPFCRDEERDLRIAHTSLKEAAMHRPPPQLKTRVVRELPRRSSRVPLLATAAVLLAAVILGAAYATLFRTPDAAMAATLSSTGLAPEAGGELTVEENGGNVRVSLDVWDLPELEAGEYYELWFVKDGQRISGGGFTVDSQGRATISTNAPGLVHEYSQVGITLEKAPGPPRPSRDKVLGGELRGA